MKRKYSALALAAVLCGCTTTAGYFPGSKVVTVDGIEYMVKKMSSSVGTSYLATLNRPTGASLLLIDPAIYAGNVKAIEKVSGCKVVAGSAQNIDNSTRAAVDCS